jgi:complement component 1 Q subcomponent-binding protein, mitochondrial
LCTCRITITFSIADLANYEADEYDEEAAMAEDGLDAEVIQPKSGASVDDAGKDLDEQTDEDIPDSTDADGAVPCRLSIVVEKPGKPGALSIEASAQDGTIVVENLYYFSKAELAHGKTADASHAAQDVYPGPPFGSLDEDLQVLLERYLEERGVTQALAVFVPDYMDAKEQREYSAWLNNLKAFVDA